MEKVKGELPIEGIKRCYVKGASIKINCPECGETLESNFESNYLSYPEVGKTTETSFYCENCDSKNKDCEYIIPIKIISAEIVIGYDKNKIEKC